MAAAGRSAFMACAYAAAPGAWPLLQILALLPLLPAAAHHRVSTTPMNSSASAMQVVLIEVRPDSKSLQGAMLERLVHVGIWDCPAAARLLASATMTHDYTLRKWHIGPLPGARSDVSGGKQIWRRHYQCCSPEVPGGLGAA